VPATSDKRRTVPKGGRGTKQSAAELEAQKRRGRIILAGAVTLSLVMLAGWFPLGSLLSQRGQLNSAAAQLSDLKAQDRQLGIEQAKLSSPDEVTKLAREQYQLVQPGQRLVQVLPPSGSASPSGTGQAPYPGDPGLTPPVRPSAVALLPTGSTPTTTTLPKTATVAAAKTSGSAGLWGRVLNTLEFWKK